MGTGAALVQLMDMLFPGKVALNKVNFNAKYDYEYIKNFSYLQDSFAKLSVDKVVEVSELVKLRPQANIEFCQWFKKFFDQHYSGEPYDALQRRVQLKITADSDKTLLKGSGGSAKPAATTTTAAKPATTTTASKPATTTSTAATKPTTAATVPKSTTVLAAAVPKPTSTAGITKSAAKPTTTTGTKIGATTKPTTTATTTKPTAATTTTTKATTTTTTTTTKPTMTQPSFKPSATRVSPKPASPTPDTVTIELQKQIEERDTKITELKESLTNFEKIITDIEMDRDFYLEKLKMVESFCVNNKNLVPVLEKVLSVLYEEGSENGQKIAEEILTVEELEKLQINVGEIQEGEEEQVGEEQEEVEQQHQSEGEEQLEEHVEGEEEQLVEEEEVAMEEEQLEEGEEVLEGEEELNEDEILEQYGNEPVEDDEHDDDVLNSTLDGNDEDLIDQDEF